MAEKNGRRPPGYILTRFCITIFYGLIFGVVLLAILTDYAAMDERESNLVFLLAGALATGWKDIVGWWFATADDEPGESSAPASATTTPPRKPTGVPDDY